LKLKNSYIYVGGICTKSQFEIVGFYSRYTHPNIGSINLKTQLLKVKVSFTILNIFGVARTIGL